MTKSVNVHKMTKKRRLLKMERDLSMMTVSAETNLNIQRSFFTKERKVVTEMANKEYKFVDEYGFDEALLKKAFAEARAIYKERGFMRKMGYGKAPAVTTVDMAKAWMSEGHPFTCDHSEEVCAEALKVLEAARKSEDNLPTNSPICKIQKAMEKIRIEVLYLNSIP